MQLRFLLFPSFMCCAVFLFAQADPNLSRKLTSVCVRDVPAGAPGVAAAVVEDGKLTFAHASGFANLDDSTLITFDTRFNIASTGKQFTALAILLLEHEGKVTLSDDIRQYFPNILPEVTDPITITHLLTHHSGIRDLYALLNLQGITWWKKTLDNGDVLDLLRKQQATNFKPGSAYAYSNSNYILLAEIVANISGQSFAEYTRAMFDHLGMSHTGFADNYQAIVEPIAYPYFNFDTWYHQPWIWNAVGDGNLFSSLRDQIIWEKILQKPDTAPFPAEVLRRSQQLNTDFPKAGYGYGLEFGTYRDIPYTYHAGGTGAWKAYIMRFPEKKLSLLTLSNSGKTSADRQTTDMADIILGLAREKPGFLTEPTETGSPVSIQDAAGIYLTESNFSFEFFTQAGDLYLRRLGRNDIRLEREGPNVFHQWNDPAFKLEFQRTATSEQQVTAYYPSHAPYSLVRRKRDWSGFVPQALNGRYYNPETDVTLRIKHLQGKTYEVKQGERERTGLLVTPHKLLVDGYVLEWEPGQADRTTLLLSDDRLKRVRFTQ